MQLQSLKAGMEKGSIEILNSATGKSFKAVCDLTERQQAILLAGGLLNYTREGGK